MRIPNGSNDRVIYFVAVDATDLKTRETGLSGFTVYRSRNGGAATAYTTPTVAELSAANMPGVYGLTIDEDTTIGASHDTEEYCLHITHASMAPVTRVLELYRPKASEGQTITVSNGVADADLEMIQGVIQSATDLKDFADAGYDPATNKVQGVVLVDAVTTVNGLAANVITAASMNADASAEIADAVWDEDATGHQTQGSFGQAIGDPGADTDSIWALANANLDAAVSSRLATAGYTAPDNATIAAIEIDTQDIQGRLPAALVGGRMAANAEVVGDKTGYALTSAEQDAIVDKVWDEATAGHQTAGTTGKALTDAGAAGDPWGAALPGAYGAGTAGFIRGTNLDALVSSRLATAGYTAPLDAAGTRAALGLAAANLDTQLSGIQADTDNIQTRLPAALSGGRMVAAVEAIDAASANKVADHTLRRTYANARQSADGDAVNFRSTLGAVGKLVNKWDIAGGVLTVYQEDGITATAPGGTQNVTGTAGADPITTRATP